VLDRERLCSSTEVCRAQLDVTVTPVRLFRLILVTVVIDDVNDNAPAFPVSSTTVPVYELAPPGSRFPLPVATDAYTTRLPLPVAVDLGSSTTRVTFSLPVATDADSGRNRVRDYVLRKSRHFRLETSAADPPTDLFLVLSSSVDHEAAVEHRLRVTACDGGQPHLTALLDVVVVIVDANDHAPVFDRSVYNATATEDCAVGTTVMLLSAEDEDAGENGRVVYSLLKTTPVTSVFGLR